MATCVNCNHEVDSNAAACPYCGRPDPGRESRVMWAAIQPLIVPGIVIGVILYGVISIFNWVSSGVQNWKLRDVLSPANIELVALYEHDRKTVDAMEAKYLPFRMTHTPLFVEGDEEVYDLDSEADEPVYPGLPVPQFMVVVLNEGEVHYANFIYAVFKNPNASEKLEEWLTVNNSEDANELHLSGLSDPHPDTGGHINRDVDNEPYSKASLGTKVLLAYIKLTSGHRIMYNLFQTPDPRTGFTLSAFDEFLVNNSK